jgi:hypothetical protein
VYSDAGECELRVVDGGNEEQNRAGIPEHEILQKSAAAEIVRCWRAQSIYVPFLETHKIHYCTFNNK